MYVRVEAIGKEEDCIKWVCGGGGELAAKLEASVSTSVTSTLEPVQEGGHQLRTQGRCDIQVLWFTFPMFV